MRKLQTPSLKKSPPLKVVVLSSPLPPLLTFGWRLTLPSPCRKREGVLTMQYSLNFMLVYKLFSL